ncbi:LytTR family DNA-binding domain-containing protein [Jannaschia sp. M317]|uniref:LytTR family DNA-binding domain-containing protein n=1 Tax=Jannaschia sp. M317 TaxID=2867011 RepID=UPI0021A4AF8E|nr:LytTR family DNA-binding domain-containing protein [Jannaschia sp. M317]UWQ16460.1 LytTR family transcriptional regulator [Jannaschia sp. M317]
MKTALAPLNQRFANDPEFFVPDPAPSSTLREMRRHFSQPVTWLVIAAIATILALVGPFGTQDLLRPVPRFGYWGLQVVLNYAAGFAVHQLSTRSPIAHMSEMPRQLTLGALTAVAVLVIVSLINWTTIGYVPKTGELMTFMGTVFAITILISYLLSLVGTATAPGPKAADHPGPPPILDRLPVDKRAPLLSLSVEDHYVRVRTTAGQEVVLMRLADAIRETEGVLGLQVHRSHWVATDQVTGTRRQGDRAILTLTDGSELPVSRRYIPAIRDAGLLPKPPRGD